MKNKEKAMAKYYEDNDLSKMLQKKNVKKNSDNEKGNDEYIRRGLYPSPGPEQNYRYRLSAYFKNGYIFRDARYSSQGQARLIVCLNKTYQTLHNPQNLI